MNRDMEMSIRRNMMIALSAQSVVLVIGVLKSLLLPHAMEVEGFGYWQQYLLYSGFVGIFALGFSDGVYLLYGGRNYSDLPFSRLRMAFRFYCAGLIIISAAIAGYALTINDSGRSFAFFFVGIDVFIACVIGLFTYILQITNQFLWYSICTVVDKIIFIIVALLFVASGLSDFRVFVCLDVLCRCISLVLICWRCHEVILGSAASFREGFEELIVDARVGINLMFANFASMLVTNLGRFIVDFFGGLANYAFYSFGMSLTNLVLTFVSAASTVLYPALKRIDEVNLPKQFRRIDSIVLIVGGLGLFLFFPVYGAVELFYQKYSPVLAYLDMMFVAAFFQAKMTLLINTFYKTLRMERRLFVVNVQCVIGFAILAFVTFWISHDIWWIAASTAISAGVRCVWSELELSRKMAISVTPMLAIQGVLIAVFLFCSLVDMSVFSGVAFALFFLTCSTILWRRGYLT